MSTTAATFDAKVSSPKRLAVLFDEVGELTGQRNAEIMVAVAHRLEEFPRCAQGLHDGRVSLDQIGVIAERAGQGSDEHYAELVSIATVTQLRTAVKLEPRPQSDPQPEPQRQITKIEGAYTPGHSPAHQPHHQRSRPAQPHSANAPTGGGTPPSNRHPPPPIRSSGTSLPSAQRGEERPDVDDK